MKRTEPIDARLVADQGPVQAAKAAGTVRLTVYRQARERPELALALEVHQARKAYHKARAAWKALETARNRYIELCAAFDAALEATKQRK